MADCRSDGAFPVLSAADDVMLSSPIILYDHPEVAPESPRDLYDATEIDEILALRVLTLTDEEKAEARGTDPRAAAIIDRCDDDAARGVGPAPRRDAARSAQSGPVRARHRRPREPIRDARPARRRPRGGTRRPTRRSTRGPTRCWSAGSRCARAMPVRLRRRTGPMPRTCSSAGCAATVAGVFTDVDGAQQVAVTVDDDPATEELAWQGRYLFFHPDEVEPLRHRGTPMSRAGVLVAGIGNIFLSDDGFGVEVARPAGGRRPLPAGVRVADFGIRGVHLAYELLDGYDGLVLVDAVPMGEPPGTVAVIEPDRGALPSAGRRRATGRRRPQHEPRRRAGHAGPAGRPVRPDLRRRLPAGQPRRGDRAVARAVAAAVRWRAVEPVPSSSLDRRCVQPDGKETRR